MEEQDWKNIINELTEQIKQISIERAVARADVQKAIALVEQLKQENQKLSDKIDARPVTTGE